MTRMRLIARFVLLVCAGVWLAACGQSAAPTGTQPAAQGGLSAVVAASELTVGQNRLPIGVVQNQTPLNDPKLNVELTFFALDDPKTPLAKSEALYLGQGLPFGLYVAYPNFPQPGALGVEVAMTPPGGTTGTTRLRLDVLDKPTTPAVGTKAIPSNNKTAADVPDLKQLTSDANPDPDLYQKSIAQEIAAKRPFLVSFGTPGFCKTAVCAPNIQVIKKLKDEFKQQVDFVHVEVYPYPYGPSVQKEVFVPAMAEWNLKTEPWTFLVDASGIIQAKYEGGITFVEMEPALKELAAGQPVTPPAP